MEFVLDCAAHTALSALKEKRYTKLLPGVCYDAAATSWWGVLVASGKNSLRTLSTMP